MQGAGQSENKFLLPIFPKSPSGEVLTPCGSCSARPGLREQRPAPHPTSSGGAFSVICVAGAAAPIDQEHILLAGCGGSPEHLVAPSKHPSLSTSLTGALQVASLPSDLRQEHFQG